MSPKEFIRTSQVPIVSDLIVVIATRSVGQENTHNNLSWFAGPLFKCPEPGKDVY